MSWTNDCSSWRVAPSKKVGKFVFSSSFDNVSSYGYNQLLEMICSNEPSIIYRESSY